MDKNTKTPFSIAAMTVAALITVLGASPSSARDLAPAEARLVPVQVAQTGACSNCGVVQWVETVQRQGQPRGMAGTQVTPGMAIGGVVGGLLGNQVGHGNGRAAATVLGVAGGAYAGHAIEKNRVRYTAYVMHIRMHDGTMRTIEQRHAIAKGARVVVEGNTARRARAVPAHG
jgi:outer membrane lipoprotein SlyB